jgi:phage repressor protein C with HTH and peptisase S24 domain
MPGLSVEGRASAAFASAWLPLLRETLEKEGVFRFPLRGASMHPTLPTACDLEIVPLPAQTPLGALIVFVINDTLIAHRLVRRSGGRWIAQGDGRLDSDRPLEPSQILGMVAAAYQDGRRCWPTAASRALTLFWVARHWALRPALAARRALRRI